MNKIEFSESLKDKTVTALLELFKLGQSGKSRIDPDFLSAIINELNSREISEMERKDFEEIMNSSFDDSPNENVKPSNEFSKEEIIELQIDKGSEDERYSTLKSVARLLSFLGNFLIIFGFIALFYLAYIRQLALGFLFLIASILIGLLIHAFINLIYVVIDIEYNTRKLSNKKNSK